MKEVLKEKKASHEKGVSRGEMVNVALDGLLVNN